MPMIDCSGIPAGVASLACISEQTNYAVGYIFLVLLAAALFYNLSHEPNRQRLAAIMLVLSLITAMGTLGNMLFPDHFFIVASVLFIGSLVLLVMRR